MQLRSWLGVATTATTLCGFLVWGCSSNNSNNGNGSDAGADTGVADAPCPVDVNLLAPVNPATNPVAAACQLCIVGDGGVDSGVPGCLAAFVSCNADCLCTEAVAEATGCIADGGGAEICGASVLVNPTFASAQATLMTLFACQLAPACASVCNPSTDAGTTPDASDASTAADAPDGD